LEVETVGRIPWRLGSFDLVVPQREEFLDLGELVHARGGKLPLVAHGADRLVVDLAAHDGLVLRGRGHVELLLQLVQVLEVLGVELAVGDRFLQLLAIGGLLLVAAEPVLDSHPSTSMPAAWSRWDIESARTSTALGEAQRFSRSTNFLRNLATLGSIT
jgi:hypothetical protein